MKGLVVTEDNKLYLEEKLPIPEIGEYEALVKNECCMICNGTDLGVIGGKVRDRSPLPRLLQEASPVSFLHQMQRLLPVLPSHLLRENTGYAPGPDFCAGHFQLLLTSSHCLPSLPLFRTLPHVPLEFVSPPRRSVLLGCL